MIICGNCKDVLKQIPDKSVRCCVTSPPYYGLRDYGVSEQIGQEDSPKDYINNLVCVFNEVHRVLTNDGTLWINIGDSYCGTGDKGDTKDHINGNGRNGQVISITKKLEGYKRKDLIGIPWMLAFALRDSGWYLRQDIIWNKLNPQPEPVKDRCTRSHEYIFLFSKNDKYHFNQLLEQSGSSNMCTLSEDGQYMRNKRDVWSVALHPYKEAHFATFPEELILPCIIGGSDEGDTVLDPFSGAGTTGVVCKKHRREYIGIELNPEYVEISNRRIESVMAAEVKDIKSPDGFTQTTLF